jgi:signal peptidase II
VPNDGGDPASTRAKRTRPGLALAIVVGVVLADQLTKLWAVHELAREPLDVIGDDVSFRLTRNTGGAFSLFQAFTPLLALIAIGVAVFLVRAVRRADDVRLVVALSLVLGGAIGNLCDRVLRSPGFLRGGVVDFIRLGPWPTFNVADASITIGAVLLVIWAFRSEMGERAADDAR